MANRSPKPNNYGYGYGTPSPGASSSGSSTPRSRLLSVSALKFENLQGLFTNLKEEDGGLVSSAFRVAGGGTGASGATPNNNSGGRKRNSTQRELVQAILEDQEQWEKLHQAMKQQRSCTSMGLTQNLRWLLQDRVSEMEAIGTYNNNSSSSCGGNRHRLNTC